MFSNRPTLNELLEAVREHLKLSGEQVSKYKNHIAANVLKIVERESQFATDYYAEENRRLAALLGAQGDNSKLRALLCEQIREGRLHYDEPQLLEHCHRTTMAKLSIDNPRYSSYLRRKDSHKNHKPNLDDNS